MGHSATAPVTPVTPVTPAGSSQVETTLLVRSLSARLGVPLAPHAFTLSDELRVGVDVSALRQVQVGYDP
ncbi:hypothetical protein ACWFMI_06045 [Nocardiopsis terrae]